MNNNNKKETVFHETAGGVVLYCNKDSLIAALLQKNTGDWVLPKGHIKPNEKNVATALREIREELGLKNKTELQMIGKLKTVKYKFKLRDDNREHIKKVSLFTFTTIKKYKLIPLLEENNIKARWFSIQVAEEKLTHESDREALREAAAKYFLWQKNKKTDKFNQSCPDLSKMVISFCNKLRRNLFALILTGSLPAGYFKNDWSDIDILIVVKNLNLKTKQLIAINKQHLENHYRRHFGINVVAVENITKPVFPAISLDGKVLQTLREIKKHPERIVF